MYGQVSDRCLFCSRNQKLIAPLGETEKSKKDRKMNQISFKDWQKFATNIRERAERLSRSRIDQGFALAATVQIPRNACCLHNASIDDELKGWCSGNVKRLKVAKKANWMVNQWAWEPTQLADRIIARAWKRLA